MNSPPPSYKSSESLSRSTTTREDVKSLADAMLRSSLSGSVSSSTSASVTSSSASTAPPSYRRTRSFNAQTRSGIPALSTLSRHLSTHSSLSGSVVKSPQVANPLSDSTADKIDHEHLHVTKPQYPELSSTAAVGVTEERGSNSIVKTSSFRVTAAESKSRVRQMQLSMKRVNAQLPPIDNKGLFKRACSTDLLFLIDTTNSMEKYLDAAKNQVKSIIRDIKATFLNETEVRIAVVSYRDHSCKDQNIQYLDFGSSPDEVSSFLDKLTTGWGKDYPEDVLGGIRQALNASWKLQSRCLIHIADAPPHGGILHNMGENADDYYEHGSEPHRLTYTPLLGRLVQLNINYALLRINQWTDRMALKFSQIYASAGADIKLLRSNQYFGQMNDLRAKACSSLRSGSSSKRGAELQFEELPLGISLDMLRHLVVKTVTRSASLTANRLTTPQSRNKSAVGGREIGKKPALYLSALIEDDSDGDDTKTFLLEKGLPRWNQLEWFNETLSVEGYCPDVGVHSASTLNDMMASDDNIKLSVTQLDIRKRSMPFAQGSLRTACYARTAASTNQFVAKSFKKDSMVIEHIVEDMRAQALCKAFALEFNSLLKTEHPIDFVVTTALQITSGIAPENNCISLEPFIKGEYVKYNSNSGHVKDDNPHDPFNDAIQAFSHFTFERSWGALMVTDLQGVGHNLTDPAIQTQDPDRFKLTLTNMNDSGFKFFFCTHECNSVCRNLGLKSNKGMFISENWDFREEWPTMDSTVCCSNKLCRRIIPLASAQKSVRFPGYHWCNTCGPQLQSTTVQCRCDEPGQHHSFDMSQFFYESQGEAVPRKCPQHLEKDRTALSPAVTGGSLWSRMQASNPKTVISGRAW